MNLLPTRTSFDKLRMSGADTKLQSAIRVAAIAFSAEAAHTLLYIPLLQGYLSASLHWTPAFPGYALTAFAAAKLIVQTPAGRAVDKLGTHISATIGLLLLLLCGVLFALVRVPLLFLGVACLYGIGAALLWPALFAVVAERWGVSEHGRLATAVQFAEALGVAAGIGAGAWLVDRAGYVAGFGLYLALITLALLTLLIGPRRSLPRTPATARSASGRHPEQSRRASGSGGHPGRGPAPAVAHLLPTPLTLDLILLGLTGALLTLSPNLLMPIVRSYALENLGLQLHDLVLPLAPVAIVGALALLSSGAVSDRLGRQPIILTGLCVGAIGLWLVGDAHRLTPAIIAAGVGTAGYLATQPAWSAAVFDVSTARNRGTQFSLVMVAQGLAEAAAPALGGKVAEAFGPGATFHLSAVVLAIAALLIGGQWLVARREWSLSNT